MPDRPLECSECRKPLKVVYTEIVGKTVNRTAMCESCPLLQSRLYGAGIVGEGVESGDRELGLCCGNCGTTLEEVRMGQALGCIECYEVFLDVLIQELQHNPVVAQKIAAGSKSYHIGRSPGEVSTMSPSVQLIALNEALAETLNREDYEQAAWLRDQIEALKEDGENERSGTDSSTKGPLEEQSE